MITAFDKITALVLIDLQKGILSRVPAEAAASLIANAKRLMQAFRAAGLPVVVVNVDVNAIAALKIRKDEPPRQPAIVPPEALELLPELEVSPTDLRITKHSWGAFFETNLHSELQQRGVTGLVLGGVATAIGVEGTARQANELGYNLVFARDAMFDQPDAQERSMNFVFPRIGEIDDTAAILAMISR